MHLAPHTLFPLSTAFLIVIYCIEHKFNFPVLLFKNVLSSSKLSAKKRKNIYGFIYYLTLSAYEALKSIKYFVVY
jgi:hypothetical protein